MVGFPPKQWRGRAWWSVYQTPLSSKRRVLKRLTTEGPLESSDFQGGPRDGQRPGGTMPLTKEDGRSLKLLWHSGKVAVSSRRTWRCVYDLAERVYPEGKPAGIQEYKNSWLMRGLSGNGVVSEGHLVNYITAPDLASSERKAVIADAVKREQVLRVQVKGLASTFYVSPEHFDLLSRLPPPSGTNLICPFDSFLWQRRRAEELLGFRYRIEIYVPPAKRQFGYYVTPILHEGRLVGRLDPKMHREEGRLEIRSVHLESGFKTDRRFEHGLGSAIRDLAEFLGADRVDVPKRGPRIRGV